MHLHLKPTTTKMSVGKRSRIAYKEDGKSSEKSWRGTKGERGRAHTLKRELPSQVRGEEVHFDHQEVTSLEDHQEDCEMDRLRGEYHTKFIEIRKGETKRLKENSVEREGKSTQREISRIEDAEGWRIGSLRAYDCWRFSSRNTTIGWLLSKTRIKQEGKRDCKVQVLLLIALYQILE